MQMRKGRHGSIQLGVKTEFGEEDVFELSKDDRADAGSTISEKKRARKKNRFLAQMGSRVNEVLEENW